MRDKRPTVETLANLIETQIVKEAEAAERQCCGDRRRHRVLLVLSTENAR
jgi:hypothetical protein